MNAQLKQIDMPSSEPTRQTIRDFEHELAKLPQLDLETEHHFADGLYGRELRIPAGTALTGKVHAGKHINVMYGDITVWTDDGMKRLTGWHVLVSAPGTKRVGYAHADTVWMTVHASEETDLKKLEAELIVPEPSPFLSHED